MTNSMAPESGGAYDLVPLPPEVDRAVPDELAAIDLTAWHPPERAGRYYDTVTITIDGKPAARGWGQVRILVPPGEHVLQVPDDLKGKVAFRVDLSAGEVVSLDFVPRTSLVIGPRFGPSPVRPAGYGAMVAFIYGLGAIAAAAIVLILIASLLRRNGGLVGVAAFPAIILVMTLLGGYAYRGQRTRQVRKFAASNTDS